MDSENFGYPNHPMPVSQPFYKATPTKNTTKDYKYDNMYNTVNSPITYGYKQFLNPDYNNLKRVSDDKNTLRQTFDVRSQYKVQQAISKYNPDNQQSYNNAQKSEVNMRQTMSTRPRFLDAYNQNTPNVQSTQVYNNEMYKLQSRGPTLNEKLQIDFKKYQQQMQQIQTSNKMTEQLRKLKQDRKKRMEANSKEINKGNTPQGEQAENFKKKTTFDFYSPKYQKVDSVQLLQQYKTMPMKNPNLQKYKYQSSVKPLTKISQLESSTYRTSAQKNDKSSKIQNTSKQKKIRDRSQTQNITPIKLPTSPSQKRPSIQKLNSTNQTNQTSLNSNFSSSSNSTINASQNNIPNTNFSSSPLMPGKQIRNFIVGKNLGEGKFGTVYQVTHKPTGALFALKKVPKQKIKALNLVNQFILELKLQTFLHHQFILTLYGFFDDSTSIYLILQYMQQGTLYSQLKKKRTLSQNVIAEQIKQIASGIKYLHENQIAHRDIKPQNIVMTNGVCKICDFGWATICTNRRTTCCGTFDYTPPQIFQGQQYDYTVDLWCLGVLTYELLVGKAPFYHSRREETKNRILNVEKTSISYPEHLSKNAISFIDSLIRKDPKDRLSSEALLDHPFLKNVQEDS